MAVLTNTGIQFAVGNEINSKYWMYPVGTKKLFVQSAAPTGWTKDTTHDNKALRVVSGNGGGSGGTNSFTTTFPASTIPISVPFSSTPQVTSPTGQTTYTVGQTTLSITQIPQHTHSSLQGVSGGSGANPFSNAGTFRVAGSTSTPGMVESTGGGAHDHSFSGTASVTTTGNTAMDLRVQYVDAIICTLN
jgi:hypothetical protein